MNKRALYIVCQHFHSQFKSEVLRYILSDGNHHCGHLTGCEDIK
jgi:hypothetical protein